MNTEVDKEQWKSIDGMHGVYQISNLGRIKNTVTGNIRKPYVLSNGYCVVRFCVNGKRNHRYVHRLVAEAFCDKKTGCNVVNHKDNDKSNNASDNLEWTTQFGNVHHGIKQKRYRLNAIPVIGFKDGKRYDFPSLNIASKTTGCQIKEISACCKKQARRSKGYQWQYLEVG